MSVMENDTVNPLRMNREREAAEVLGVSLTYLRKKTEHGGIKLVWWGRERRYPHFYLEEWLREKLLETSLKDLADPSRVTLDNLVALYQVKKNRDSEA
jgi:excisionase family DNA binding protein